LSGVTSGGSDETPAIGFLASGNDFSGALPSALYQNLLVATGKYTAQIRCNGKQHYVGTYSTEDLAKEGYDRAAQQIADTVRRHRPSSEAACLTAACLLGCGTLAGFVRQ